MPEGDTLHRTAITLQRVLGQQRLVRVRSSVPAVVRAELAGHVVLSVSALGKNLLVQFDDGRILHTHLKMHGSWHVYRHGERFQRPEHEARVVLEVADAIAVCFAAPTVRLLPSSAALTDEYLAGIGPDLIPDDFDAERAIAQLLALADRPIGEAVMTQTALAGIGNIFKSETLFLCRANPFSMVATLDDEAARRIVLTARRLLRASVHSPSRQRVLGDGTHAGYWVYRRSGRPCKKCGDIVRMQRQGSTHRSTYFCPTCQSVPSAV